jgi:subtilisin family serine protease
VTVVAAAGNFSTRRHFYPAAFSTLPTPGPVPLISVGALNPNGTRALFSDGGRWVKAWAKGASVVSTYPYDIRGHVSPPIKMKEREGLDSDDYSGGFAVWSGTSFAAPLLAAHIARQLLADAEAGRGPGLDQLGDVAAMDRTMAALGELNWLG